MTIEEIRIELIEDYEILILAWLQSDSENTTLLSESLAKHATELVKSTLAPVSLEERSESTVCEHDWQAIGLFEGEMIEECDKCLLLQRQTGN